MLRLLREHVRVGLFEDRIVAVRMQGPWGWCPAAQSVVQLTGHAPEISQAFANRLPEALNELGLRGPASVSVWASNHHVRYQLLPWSEALRRDSDWQAFARNRFSRAFGPDAARADLRISTAPKGHARVASALSEQVHTSLRSALASSGHTLTSLEPALMTAVRRLKHHTDIEATWIVSHEPGVLLIGYMSNRQWRSLRLRRVGDDWKEALEELLLREGDLLGLADTSSHVLIDAPTASQIPPNFGAFSVLNSGSPTANQATRAIGISLLH